MSPSPPTRDPEDSEHTEPERECDQKRDLYGLTVAPHARVGRGEMTGVSPTWRPFMRTPVRS